MYGIRSKDNLFETLCTWKMRVQNNLTIVRWLLFGRYPVLYSDYMEGTTDFSASCYDYL